MTIGECLKYLEKELKKCSINNYQLEAELLIEHFLNVDKKYLLLNRGERISWLNSLRIKNGLRRRRQGHSIAYIKKEKYFYKSKFFVNRNVLVPRPESELIIEEIVKKDIKNTSIIDIGTGSGCLIISALRELENDSNDFYGLDISRKALRVAKRNNTEGGIIFKKSNLLEAIKESDLKGKVIIMANLPYLTKDEIKKSKTIKKEPVLALYGGKDGLDLYRKLLSQIAKFKKNHIELYMEISDWQKDSLLELIDKSLDVRVLKDLSGQNRLVHVSFNTQD